MKDNELFRGTLATVILHLLSVNGQMYGYEITKRVFDLTDGEINIKEGSLYPALHKLEKEKVIHSYFEYHGKRKRKYYQLTDSGKTEAINKVLNFEKFNTAIYKILTPKPKLT